MNQWVSFPTRAALGVGLLCLSAGSDPAGATSKSDLPFVLGSKHVVLETPTQVSPPAIQFNGQDIHLAWFERNGAANHNEVKLARMAATGQAAPTVTVNRNGQGPAAIHQAPGLAVGREGFVYVTWSASTPSANGGGGMFASDLLLARSKDGGTTFLDPTVVNDDGKPISHSFEDVMVGPTENVYVSWLDGRAKDRSGAAALCACSQDEGNSIGPNVVIDNMACPCCRPAVATAPDGQVWVAWRKTFEGNVRDIVVAHSSDQGRHFSAPLLVSRDGWVFDACPHRGPSVGFDDKGRLYVAWYTEGTDEQPRVYMAASDDQARTFSDPLPLHVSPTSLPDHLSMAVHPDGLVVVVWEEVTGVRKRVVMRTSVDRGMTFGPRQMLSDGSKAEHPTAAVHPDGTVAIAWTEHQFPNNKIVMQRGRFNLKETQK
jgi:hypothetical protein